VALGVYELDLDGANIAIDPRAAFSGAAIDFMGRRIGYLLK